MINEIDKQKNSLYCIYINGGDRTFLLGHDGSYLIDNDLDKAMEFCDVIDAATFIEKHGLQRLANIRKMNIKVKA